MYKQLLSYNVWANKRIAEMLSALKESDWEQPIVSSFSNIRNTLVHLKVAEELWLKRVKGESLTSLPSDSSGIKELLNFYQGSELWLQYAVDLQEPEFQKTIHYNNTKGEPFTNTLGTIIAHLVNHGTFHRGQLIAMFRQVGMTHLLSTDYIVYARTNGLSL